VPTWYRLIKAGQYLQVPPWVLAEQPLAWIERAEEAQAAENHAKVMLDKMRQAQDGLR
jgi:hypothetical protein